MTEPKRVPLNETVPVKRIARGLVIMAIAMTGVFALSTAGASAAPASPAGSDGQAVAAQSDQLGYPRLYGYWSSEGACNYWYYAYPYRKEGCYSNARGDWYFLGWDA